MDPSLRWDDGYGGDDGCGWDDGYGWDDGCGWDDGYGGDDGYRWDDGCGWHGRRFADGGLAETYSFSNRFCKSAGVWQTGRIFRRT